MITGQNDQLHQAKSAYEQWHADLDVDFDADTPWHRLVRQYLRMDEDVAGRCVMEIGCGRGGLSCWLAANAPSPPQRMVAIDFAESAIAKACESAKQRRLLGIDWQVGDIQTISHPAESFDTVISCETIEHVPDPRRAVDELARVLKPGGRLLVTAPNYIGTIGLYRGYMRLRGRRFTEVGQPINNFTMLPRTRAWVRRAGLLVLAVDAVGHYLPFPGRPPIHVEALDRPRRIMRWLALHSLVLAEKPIAA
jgi:2-polyprenyl-3-methyl-5-hydroxy-6-metoxy-1,4-benzoquinol methylase